jgi:hypothetical protein
MSITWADYRDYIRIGLLNDEDLSENNGPTPNWSNEQLLIFLEWAQNAFCSHTAKVQESVTLDYTGTTLALPTNVYDNFGNTAFVQVNSGNSPVVYKSAVHAYGAGLSTTVGHYYVEIPSGTLKFLKEIKKDSTVTITYFSKYAVPASDTDLLEIPDWSHAAIANLVAAHAQMNYAMRRANLSQWAETPEKGNPEDNPFMIMHKAFTQTYEREIGRVTAQHRTSMFAEDDDA